MKKLFVSALIVAFAQSAFAVRHHEFAASYGEGTHNQIVNGFANVVGTIFTLGYADVTDAVTQAQSINPDETAYVYVTLDSIIASNFNQLGQALTEAGIPVYGAADAMTTGGAFCSYGVDYGTVGEMTAEMVIEWYNGTPLESMPCRQYSDFTLVINEDVMNALGITLPDSYAEAATYVTTH